MVKELKNIRGPESERLPDEALASALADAPTSHTSAEECVNEWIDTRVILDGLKSSTGEQLNGRIGTIVKYETTRRRFIVDVEGFGLKLFKLENLIPDNAPQILTKPLADLEVKQHSHSSRIQVSAIETSTSDGCVADTNAQVSRALLGGVPQPRHAVVLLKFERKPRMFLKALMSSDEVKELRDNMEAQGQPIIQDSRAKFFVRPDHYDAVVDAIKKHELKLFADHVVVEPEFEESVINILRRIVKPKQGGRAIIDLAPNVIATEFSDNAQDIAGPEQQGYESAVPGNSECNNESVVFKISVVRTFIHLDIPSSLYTPSCGTHAKTG